MKPLLCDSGPLIATFNDRDREYARCSRLLAEWQGQLIIPEPVLAEVCGFLRNNVRNGPILEVQFLEALNSKDGDFEIVSPESEDRVRAFQETRFRAVGLRGWNRAGDGRAAEDPRHRDC
ncbi:hypothetical protein ACQEVF_31820 [Nonomuraea polychroma]|uniref:hypothetical protein n=1 Tax=Nonomuraea polychroma TaxID=46176 RepID=UPI003D8E3CC4